MEGNWPTDLFKDQKARFNAALGPKRKSDIEPLQDRITNQKHPWNFISMATLVGGGIGTFSLANIWEQAVLPMLVATGLGFAKTRSIAKGKNRIMASAQSDLSNYVRDAIGIDIVDVSRTHGQVLQTFTQAGFLGRFHDVHYLAGLRPKRTDAADPNTAAQDPATPHLHSIGTKLTRTETETYTDSQGRTRTRQRIVKVFEGLMLELDVEGFDSDNRIVISSRRTYRASGPFDRVRNGKRFKMDKIKPASLEFNKYYKVTTDDQTLAHLFLDPDRVMRFINLNADLRQALGRKNIDISILITKGRMWVALETAGLPSLTKFSPDPEKLDAEINEVLGQAALPHMIAQHLELPNPVPYAWQDHILDEKNASLV